MAGLAGPATVPAPSGQGCRCRAPASGRGSTPVG